MESDETMANDDQFDDGFEDNRGFDDAPPAKTGSSGGKKFLMILLIGGGVLALLCCGGVGLVYFYFKDAVKIANQPAEVRQFSDEIVRIDVPERFTPQFAMQFKLFDVGMSMAIYVEEADKAMIMLMETTQAGGGNAEQQLEEIQRSMKQQGQGGEFEQAQLEETETETRELTVRGQATNFEFTKGKNTKTGEDTHQISGVFPSDDGSAVLLIQIPAESYNEDEIVQMIESIE